MGTALQQAVAAESCVVITVTLCLFDHPWVLYAANYRVRVLPWLPGPCSQPHVVFFFFSSEGSGCDSSSPKVHWWGEKT